MGEAHSGGAIGAGKADKTVSVEEENNDNDNNNGNNNNNGNTHTGGDSIGAGKADKTVSVETAGWLLLGFLEQTRYMGFSSKCGKLQRP